MCEICCSPTNILHLFGMLITTYGIVAAYNMSNQCFNYANISIIWSNFEVLSFLIWLTARFIVDWYVQMSEKETFDIQIRKALAQRSK